MSLKKTALVTGGDGFIGSALVRRLLESHYSVHIITKRPTNFWRLRDILSDITLHEIALDDRGRLDALVNKIRPSQIFHLATHGAYPHQIDVDEIIRVNIQGTVNLLTASRDIAYTGFVYTGSSSEYGFKTKPHKETDILKPVDFYAATKASATLLCQVFAKQYSKPIVILRPFSVYGPREEPTRLVPSIISSLLNNRPIELTSAQARRDFVYIEDVVDALIMGATRARLHKGGVYNIGSGKQHTILAVVKELFRAVGKSVPIKRGALPTRKWETTYWVADVSRTKEELGWRSKVSLAEGLVQTYEWMKVHKKDNE